MNSTRAIHQLCLVLPVALAACAQPQSQSPVTFVLPSGLPDPLILQDGSRVKDAETWRTRRRPEILELFRTHIYGRTPDTRLPVTFTKTSEVSALGGLAIRREVAVRFSADHPEPRMDLLIYLPANAKGPVPVFMALNFCGNHSVSTEPDITLSRMHPRMLEGYCKPPGESLESARGMMVGSWPIEMIVKRGYAVATAHYGDLDPDFDDFSNGVHPLFYGPGQTRPADDQWGAIGAWAWGISRAIDYFETVPELDKTRVSVVGHSRLGKTALWAGAQDQRIALVVSNDSGMFGAAMTRRQPWNATRHIQTRNYWFVHKLQDYLEDQSQLPVDQHMLIALIAPRPVYVASAVQDDHADPPGEFLSALQADPVYRLLGVPGLSVTAWPRIEQPLHAGLIGHHIRKGRHEINSYDWQQILNFADRHLPRP